MTHKSEILLLIAAMRRNSRCMSGMTRKGKWFSGHAYPKNAQVGDSCYCGRNTLQPIERCDGGEE